MLFRQVARSVLTFVVALCLSGALMTSSSMAQGKDFKDQDLKNKSFRGQALDGADFSGATLVHTDFSGASLRGAKFDGAEVTVAIFAGANLTGADMRNMFGTFITGETNFTNVNMEGLDLKRTSFYNGNFRNANLRKTTGWSSVYSSSFRGADLRGANLMGMKPVPDQGGMFFGAIYDDDTIWPKWVDLAKSGAKKAK